MDDASALLALAVLAGALLGLLCSIIALQIGKSLLPNGESLIADPPDEFSPNRFSSMRQHMGAVLIGALGLAALTLVFGAGPELFLLLMFVMIIWAVRFVRTFT